MTDYRIEQIARKYRLAIETAKDDGLFVHDKFFSKFPDNCCGDTSYLLAEYLREKGVETIWYSAEQGDDTHAWLVVNDKRVRRPAPRSFSWPEYLKETLGRYGVENPKEEIDQTRYAAEDLEIGLIIDITGDQFGDYASVYVGYMDALHRSFEFKEASDYERLSEGRRWDLYEKIGRYL